VALALLLPLAVFLTGTWLTGRQLQLVQSGSMEPTYPVGSMLVVKSVTPSEIDVGTPLTFEDPRAAGQLVTHRVIEVIRRDDGIFFRTRGDANGKPDPSPVPARLVRGSVEWHVPELGRALESVRWPRGFLALVVVPGLILTAHEVQLRRRRQPEGTEPAVS
jgi:signal peptidase